jgi:hypothetical protein
VDTVYNPGTAGGKPDTLTSISHDLPREGDDHSLGNRTTVIKPENVIHTKDLIHALATTYLPLSKPMPPDYTPDIPILSRLFPEAYAADTFPSKVLKILQDGTKQCKDLTLAK